jgi:hypothetical protein
MPNGLDVVTERMEEGCEEPEVLLLGRDLRGGWCAVLELEGTCGWTGTDPRVLAALSADGQTAVSAYEDPNRIRVQVAVDGAAVCELDVVTGRFVPAPSGDQQAVRDLLAVGFSLDDEVSGQAADSEFSQRAVLALRAVTGVELTEDDFSGPWLGGLSALGA